MRPDPEQEEIKRLKKKLKEQEKKNSDVRGLMAIQRTIFANERTLMAYLRTAIALLAGGFAAIKLSGHKYMEVLGAVLIVLGSVLALYSFFRYFQKQRLIKQQKNEFMQTSHHHAKIHEKEASRYGNED